MTAKRLPNTYVYEILHNGRVIGTLSNKMVAELSYGIEATDYKYNLPDKLDDLFIREVTTEIINSYDNKIPMEFQRSQICYGIQLTGLASLNFKEKS